MKRLALTIFLYTSTALAQGPGANEMIARGHYQRGVTEYNAARYEEARSEFEAANVAKASPELVFNIARCLDALGRKVDAVITFRRYIELNAGASNAAAVRARIDLLEHQVAETELTSTVMTSSPVFVSSTVPASLPPAPKRRHSAAFAVGGGAFALAAIGAGLLGSAATSFHELQTSCSAGCAPGAWSALPAREHSGEAILGIAGAVAVVDVALWVIELKKARR